MQRILATTLLLAMAAADHLGAVSTGIVENWIESSDFSDDRKAKIREALTKIVSHDLSWLEPPTDLEAYGLEVIDSRAKDKQTYYAPTIREMYNNLMPLFEKNPKLARVFDALSQPERVIQFRVPWEDDKGVMHYNTGYRVQQSSLLGPYKGGLRFEKSVDLDTLHFLALEQMFKNALTGLTMGGAKGGSDFDPAGKSDAEIRRFSRAFMRSLANHVGPETDVPAGDINVGGSVIAAMYREYQSLTNKSNGVLTGKGLSHGGSHLRPEATGYGTAYFTKHYLEEKGLTMKGVECAISGSGNVAIFLAEKLLELQAKVLTFSDRAGHIIKLSGFTKADIEVLKDAKFDQKISLKKVVEDGKIINVQYKTDGSLWAVPHKLSFPCATQFEVHATDAEYLVKHEIYGVFEGANKPLDPQAVDILKAAGVFIGPGKAVNAGGVAVSGLEMAQNHQFIKWSKDKVDTFLDRIMKGVLDQGMEAASFVGRPGDFSVGAVTAGFALVASAYIDFGGM